MEAISSKVTVWSLAGVTLLVLFVAGYGLATINLAATVEIELEPQNGSGVHGTATFEDMPGNGVEVRLDVGGFRSRAPGQHTFYLSHIHAGSCVQGEEKDHDHDHYAGSAEEIEYPLSPIDPDTQGKGSSITTLWDTSLDKLFSGRSKRLNIHDVGSGNPPVLACGDLKDPLL